LRVETPGEAAGRPPRGNGGGSGKRNHARSALPPCGCPTGPRGDGSAFGGGRKRVPMLPSRGAGVVSTTCGGAVEARRAGRVRCSFPFGMGPRVPTRWKGWGGIPNRVRERRPRRNTRVPEGSESRTTTRGIGGATRHHELAGTRRRRRAGTRRGVGVPLMPVFPLRRAALRPYLWGPTTLVAAGVLVPLAYLLVRAFEAEPAQLVALVVRER